MIIRIALLVSFIVALFATLPDRARAQDDIREHRSCSLCGMDRKAYGYSRMLIQFQGGVQIGVCSLHCAVSELDADRERAVKSILVADRDTRLMIDAEKAFWVLGGSKRGVMTPLPKWAFGSEAAARAFITDYGGRLASWTEALAAARAETNDKPRR